MRAPYLMTERPCLQGDESDAPPPAGDAPAQHEGGGPAVGAAQALGLSRPAVRQEGRHIVGRRDLEEPGRS